MFHSFWDTNRAENQRSTKGHTCEFWWLTCQGWSARKFCSWFHTQKNYIFSYQICQPYTNFYMLILTCKSCTESFYHYLAALGTPVSISFSSMSFFKSCSSLTSSVSKSFIFSLAPTWYSSAVEDISLLYSWALFLSCTVQYITWRSQSDLKIIGLLHQILSYIYRILEMDSKWYICMKSVISIWITYWVTSLRKLQLVSCDRKHRFLLVWNNIYG